MKKKLLMVMCVMAMTMTGCAGAENEVSQGTEVAEPTEQMETEIHSHVYEEEITTAATCETDGVKTFTCECGDTYTDAIPASGHIYENYVSNEDATYLADGTETATCNGCDLTDTRIAEGTKLEYTYTDVSATKYAKQSVNVRSLPSTDGERLGSLTMNQEVTVTGQCNETKWYRIKFNNEEAYVSNNYLVDEKVVVSQAPATPNADNVSSGSTTIPDAGNSNSGSVVTPDAGNADSGSVTTPDSGNANAGTITPEPEQEQTPSEPVENPNNYPTASFDEINSGNLAPGTYWVDGTVVTIMPPEEAPQYEVYFDQYGNKYDYPVDAEGNPL